MPPEHKRELLTLILMIGLIGLVLIVTTILLMSVWRRNLRRQKAGVDRESAAEAPDIWQAGGQRLLSDIAGNTHAQVDEDTSFDPGFGGSDNDDDDEDDYDDGYPREEPI